MYQKKYIIFWSCGDFRHVLQSCKLSVFFVLYIIVQDRTRLNCQLTVLPSLDPGSILLLANFLKCYITPAHVN
jgi:hypothetical protein